MEVNEPFSTIWFFLSMVVEGCAMRFAVFLGMFLAFPLVCSAQSTWYVPDDFSEMKYHFYLDGTTTYKTTNTYSTSLALGWHTWMVLAEDEAGEVHVVRI